MAETGDARRRLGLPESAHSCFGRVPEPGPGQAPGPAGKRL